MFLYPRMLLSLVLGGIAAEIYWLNSSNVLSGWIAAGIGLLCAVVIWLITAKLFPVIHDVATLTSSEDEEERVPDTDCKPEEEVLTGRMVEAKESVSEVNPTVEEESEPAEVYHYDVSTENPEPVTETWKQQALPVGEDSSVVETIIYEAEEEEELPTKADTTIEVAEDPVVLLMPNELSELGREIESFQVSSYRGGQQIKLYGTEALQVHLQRIAMYYNDTSVFQYTLTKNDEILFGYLTRFYRFAKGCVETSNTCVEVKNFYSRYIEPITEGYLQLMVQVQNETARDVLKDIYKRARKLRKLMDRPFNKSFAA